VFIVLVSLLSVLIVPLVVVYAYNENSYKTRWEASEVQRGAAQQAAQQAQARQGSEVSAVETKNAQLDADLRAALKAAESDKANLRALDTKLAAAEGLKTEIASRLTILADTVQAGQQLTDSLVTELRQLRSDAVAVEKQKVELDEALRDVTGQLEVAVAARRALEEEMARLKDEHAKSLTQLGLYISQYGNMKDIRVSGMRDRGVFPDKSLTAKVIRVERSSGQVLAEIDAGSRDGVKRDWAMSIFNGPTFIGNLRILNVDINRSTGIVTSESSERGLVQPNFQAIAVAGQ